MGPTRGGTIHSPKTKVGERANEWGQNIVFSLSLLGNKTPPNPEGKVGRRQQKKEWQEWKKKTAPLCPQKGREEKHQEGTKREVG